MDQTPNCRKCAHCLWDEQWEEYICDECKHVVYKGNDFATCNQFKERGKEDAE